MGIKIEGDPFKKKKKKSYLQNFLTRQRSRQFTPTIKWIRRHCFIIIYGNYHSRKKKGDRRRGRGGGVPSETLIRLDFKLRPIGRRIVPLEPELERFENIRVDILNVFRTKYPNDSHNLFSFVYFVKRGSDLHIQVLFVVDGEVVVLLVPEKR